MFSFSDLYVYFCYIYLNKLRLYGFWDKERRGERIAVLRDAATHAKGDGLFLEFGVQKGLSINKLAEWLPDKTIYGFDSFTGFPDDGRIDWKQDFATDIPKVCDNVQLVQGYFEDTLPCFLESHREKVSFMHVDCDIYSSTHTIFQNMLKLDRIGEGTVIAFDELINYKTSFWNEILALYRFLLSSSLNISWLRVHQEVENIDENLYLLKKGNYPYGMKYNRGDGKYWRQQASCVITTTPIDYSGLDNDVILDKIKYMSHLLEKITKDIGANSLGQEDFHERYALENGQPVIADNKPLMVVPFMLNTVDMPRPHEYVKNFVDNMGKTVNSVIEIGGWKVNSLQGVFPGSYTNFDLASHTGIETVVTDIVHDDMSEYNGTADIVYSNNTFEHMANPFIAAEKMCQFLRPGGILFVRAPFAYRYHPVPNDYWRFTPEGLRALFPKLQCLEYGMDAHNRRKNDKGNFANGLDRMPIDDLGGWREIWFSYFIGQKLR